MEICCPACRGEMDWVDASQLGLECGSCGQGYPVLSGIPDLRVFPDPYIGIEADRAKGLKVAENAGGRDFESLIDFYYGMTEVVPPQHARRYKRGLLAGVPRAQSALAAWEAAGATGPKPVSGRLLEIGCGTGPLLVAARQRFEQVVGIDIAFRWLVVGRKRLAEAGLDAPLICACAEALPFPDQSFDCVAADSVIEHTASQVDALKEARRVMDVGGKLFLSTPNRLSIGPDPHTGLPAGGMLPRKLTDSYVRRLGGIPPRRQLLSVMSTNRLVRQCGFHRARVFLPDVTTEQRALFPPITRRLIDCYRISRRLPLSRHFLYLFGPMFYAVAEAAPVQRDMKAATTPGRV